MQCRLYISPRNKNDHDDVRFTYMDGMLQIIAITRFYATGYIDWTLVTSNASYSVMKAMII